MGSGHFAGGTARVLNDVGDKVERHQRERDRPRYGSPPDALSKSLSREVRPGNGYETAFGPDDKQRTGHRCFRLYSRILLISSGSIPRDSRNSWCA